MAVRVPSRSASFRVLFVAGIVATSLATPAVAYAAPLSTSSSEGYGACVTWKSQTGPATYDSTQVCVARSREGLQELNGVLVQRFACVVAEAYDSCVTSYLNGKSALTADELRIDPFTGDSRVDVTLSDCDVSLDVRRSGAWVIGIGSYPAPIEIWTDDGIGAVIATQPNASASASGIGDVCSWIDGGTTGVGTVVRSLWMRTSINSAPLPLRSS